MFNSTHCHVESYLTGSTLANMVKKAKELGRTHLSITDLGHLSSSLKAYGMIKKAGIKPVLGVELYFKDPKCEIISGSPSDRCKYFNVTLYAQDQEAFQELSKLVSKNDLPKIELYEEIHSLYNWESLEQLSKFNIQIVLSGIHDMVAKPYLAGNPILGEKVLCKLLNLFKDKVSVAIVAEPWSKKWTQVVEIKYTDGSRSSLPINDLVATDKARNIKAIELTEKKHHSIVKSVISNGFYSEINKEISYAKLHSGFLPLPGGDASLKVNKFLMALANKYGVKVLVSDYAYYASKEDKIVQTMVLEGKNKLQPNLHMKSEAEIKAYLSAVLNLNEESSNTILQNNEEWVKKFDSFKLDYPWRLAEVEGGQSAIQKIMHIIKENGRMKWDDPKYVNRLKEEIDVIHRNGVYDLSPYFLPIRDVLNHYLENDELVGCGRGSSGASLICYCLGITQVDPFKYDLPFQRFFSMVRIKQKKLPDIDCLHPKTNILTDRGWLTIEHLSLLSINEYPKLASFDGSVFQYQYPVTIFKKGKAMVKKYHLDNGNSIACTPDHLVLTQNGYKTIEECYEKEIEIIDYRENK